jgi:hypothetical protein
MVNDFMLHAQSYTKVAAFSDQDRKMMKFVFPADILIRYILQGEDSFLVVDNLLASIYDREVLDMYFRGFLADDT